MKKMILFVAICLILGGSAYAQDPGVRDTIVVENVVVPNQNDGFCFVRIWVTTDDSVAYYNLPLAWIAPNYGINAGEGTLYFNPLTTWSLHYDTLMFDDGYMRQFGFQELPGDSLAHLPLLTGNVRRHVWSMYFGIPPEAHDVYVRLDTIRDARNGSMKFGLADGLTEFKPVFLPGSITVGAVGIDGDEVIPSVYSLNQNYPNPFNPETNIEFSLVKEQNVIMTVYNVLGQNVRTLINGSQGAGTHTVRWDGKNDRGLDVPSGIYFYKISTPEFTQTNKMLMLR